MHCCHSPRVHCTATARCRTISLCRNKNKSPARESLTTCEQETENCSYFQESSSDYLWLLNAGTWEMRRKLKVLITAQQQPAREKCFLEIYSGWLLYPSMLKSVDIYILHANINLRAINFEVGSWFCKKLKFWKLHALDGIELWVVHNSSDANSRESRRAGSEEEKWRDVLVFSESFIKFFTINFNCSLGCSLLTCAPHRVKLKTQIAF